MNNLAGMAAFIMKNRAGQLITKGCFDLLVRSEEGHFTPPLY